jgi:tetratricopeptide (TPR) repeat protein
MLSRLFVTMRIRPSNQVSLQSERQNFSYVSVKKYPSQYLSQEDLMNLVGHDQIRDRTCTLKGMLHLTKNIEFESSEIAQWSEAGLRFPQMDILFPSEILVPPSPFMELNPFPRPTPAATKRKSNSILRSMLYHNELMEWKQKYVNLQPMLSESNPVMISIMQKLGTAYYRTGQVSQAEHWYRSALSAKGQPANLSSIDSLNDWLGLIDAINAQGRYTEARILHQETHPAITNLVAPDHWLFQKSLQIIAIVSGNLDSQEAAESYYRQLVQIRLNALGPCHGDTLAAIQRLADPLRRQHRFDESEELLSITVQLSQSAPSMSEKRVCRALSSLAKVLFQKEQYKESEYLHRMSLERSQDALGSEDPTTMQCAHLLARTLRMQSRFTESERLLRDTIQKQTRILGELSPSTINSVSELGETLEMAGRHREATQWYLKSLEGFSSIWGPDHDDAMIACENLGRCYEVQDRHSDALSLYASTMEKIKDTRNIIAPNEYAIAEVQGWIDRVCALLL